MLQNTLDRAILAAADIENKLGPEAVVKDYFKKAGLDETKVVVTPQTADGFKQVRAVSSTVMDTWFMHIFDIQTLEAPAAGTAKEGYGHVEVSLVLDVSGSMGNTISGKKRIDWLHTAGEKFINKIFLTNKSGGATESVVSVSLVPYAQQVTLGATAASYFTLSNDHASSHCVDFYDEDGDYETTTIDPAVKLSQSAHIPIRNSSFYECVDDPTRFLLPFSTSKANMITRIKALAAER